MEHHTQPFQMRQYFTVAPGSFAVVPVPGGPDRMSLKSNAVNLNWYLPVESESKLKYELEEFVFIRICDMHDREIRTLYKSEVSVGTHLVQWDGLNNSGSRIPSRAYIHKIISGDNVYSTKIKLLK